MKVRVRLFADFKRLAGTDMLELDVPENVTVGEVVEAVRTSFPALRSYQQTILVAKGVEFATSSDPVCENEEISLMPPVMGG